MARKAQTKSRSSKSASAKKYTFETLMVPYAVIVLAILLGGASMWLQQREFKATMPSETYQAVFLTNGQVYFGQLSPINRHYMKLDDVYYLQSSVTPGEETVDLETGETVATEPETEFAVFRLGEAEIHQPVNEMVINTDHILLWENMDPESQVIDAIEQEKSGQ